MIKSSCAAALKVSWVNTPVITDTIENPMTSLVHKKNTMKLGCTLCIMILQGTIKLPSDVSNIVRTERAKVPEYLNTVCPASVWLEPGAAASSMKGVHNTWRIRARIVFARERRATDQKSTGMLPLIAVVMM